MSRIEPIVARLHSLHPRLIDLSLDRLLRLLAQLGHPERRLPPIIHVAGTNGKGSTCAFIRAIAEGNGLAVHVYTSPHLMRFNERFRIAGRLVSDDALAEALETIERVNDGAAITVFEVITAAAFLLFAATPADLCVLEVGLGGRGDATNVVTPAACAVTSISMDHRELLGDTLPLIAAEKAGILKPGVPAVTGQQPPGVLEVLERTGPVRARGRDWWIEPDGDGLRYWDAAGELILPKSGLPGAHQVDNAGIAISAIRAAQMDSDRLLAVKPSPSGRGQGEGGPAVEARPGGPPLGRPYPHPDPLPEGEGVKSTTVVSGLGITDFTGLANARWPARLQRLHGRLAALVPDRELWLDGGHNPGAGDVLATQLAEWGPTHLVVGMKQAKDTAEFLRPLLPHAASLWAVAEPDQHLALPVETIVAASGGMARVGPTVAEALRSLDGAPGRVLICGSLYLAGEVLKADGVELA